MIGVVSLAAAPAGAVSAAAPAVIVTTMIDKAAKQALNRRN
jgi:hypothetical protein